MDLDFPQSRDAREVQNLRDDVQRLFRSQQSQIETEGLGNLARLLEPVRSADELADLKMALDDALRLGKQTVTTPRKPSRRPPEFVDEEEEEELM